MSSKLRVAIVGAGWTGTQRAATVADHPRTEVALVVDTDADAAQRLADSYGASSTTEAAQVLEGDAVDIVVIATPNAYLAELTLAALRAGRHVLVEEPMARNATEAKSMADAVSDEGRVLKVGFNHRYHPALTRAQAYFSEGVIGNIINIRARYGHGVRPGRVGEWREQSEVAGGGQLTDHGVHVLDLIHWFAGPPKDVFAFLQTAVWPVKPLEDSAFALLRFESGIVASMHTAWTQWTDLFSFEVFGTQGSISVEGLGGRYGQQTLTVARRKADDSRPYTETTVFDDEDLSWAAEWAEFVGAVEDGRPYMGSPQDGVIVMNILDGLYRSAESGKVVTL